MNQASLLDDMKQYLRPNEFWDSWLESTGELPPDFDEMPCIPNLPDPLAFQGDVVRSATDWPQTRSKILDSFKHFILGSYPEAPGNVTAEVLDKELLSNGVSVQEVLLSFGPENRARLHAQLALPAGDGPFPVFMTQRNHIGWARIALSRGYAAVIYDGCDQADDTQAFKEVWPEADWSMLCRRAWAAGRVLDWLHTLPEIDKNNASISGHSRNGKLSLICGAIDERFNVVISSSSGIGGASPYRLANEAQFSEGIELLTFFYNEWFHQRLRFFAGHEHRLPVDANLLIALSAPRAVLISSALNDPCESMKANELAIRSAQTVFNVLDSSSRLGAVWRPGGHETRAEEIERFVDWCDLHFGRLTKVDAEERAAFFTPKFRYGYSFSDWKERSGEQTGPKLESSVGLIENALPKDRSDWERGQGSRIERIKMLLGKEPLGASRSYAEKGVEPEYFRDMLHRCRVGGDTKIDGFPFSFGEHIFGKIYLPEGTLESLEKSNKKIPLAIWVHPESISSGYSGAYFKGRHLPGVNVLFGMAVLGFDQIGCGTRVPEIERFHTRYPGWSLLGKIIHDIRRAVDAARKIPWIDSERIFLYGFGSGATAALMATAMDERIAGVASVCGFSPLRSDTSDRATGGLARYALWDGGGLIPRLGFFHGAEEQTASVPIDFDEILASIAPRPLFCCAPKYDREVNQEDVLHTFKVVQQVYERVGASEQFEFKETIDFRSYRKASDNFQLTQAWLNRHVGLDGFDAKD